MRNHFEGAPPKAVATASQADSQAEGQANAVDRSSCTLSQ